MLTQTWATTRRALFGQPAIWSVLVWPLVFFLLVLGIATAIGGLALVQALAHPPGVAPQPVSALARVGAGFFVVALLGLAAGPFWLAGTYGVVGTAVQDQPITWRSFWRLGAALYGRGWGVIAYSLLYGLALSVVALLFVALLHTAGVIFIPLAILFSMPWILRMMGGLFVTRLSWSESFRASFRRSGYWSLLGGQLLTVVVGLVIVLVTLLATRMSLAFGMIVEMVLEAFMAVAVVTWNLALYHTVS